MQPTLCSRCKKNVAVIFITRIENGESHNEGLCLRCARELHIKPVDEMMEKLGISDADLDNLTGDVAEMLGSMGMLGGDGAADADAAGWYDIWYAVHFHLWYAGSRGYEEYDDYGNYIGNGQANYGNHSGSEMISESRVQKINEVTVTQMATQWKNENNYSRPVSSKITTVNVRIFLADYRYSGSVVTATTEVEYWIGGGSPTGSVYATVTIDLYTGDVLSASIG